MCENHTRRNKFKKCLQHNSQYKILFFEKQCKILFFEKQCKILFFEKIYSIVISLCNKNIFKKKRLPLVAFKTG